MLSEVAKAFPGEEAWAKSVSRGREGGKREGERFLTCAIYTFFVQYTHSFHLSLPPFPYSLPPSTAQTLGAGGGFAAVRCLGRVPSDEGHERLEGDLASDHADGAVG